MYIIIDAEDITNMLVVNEDWDTGGAGNTLIFGDEDEANEYIERHGLDGYWQAVELKET